jgi:hypothetical protein
VICFSAMALYARKGITIMENWDEIDRYLIRLGIRIDNPTQATTTGGGHAKDSKHFSYHYVGSARDYGRHTCDAEAVARKLEVIAMQPRGPVAELFYSPSGTFIKNGRRLLARDNSEIVKKHWTHCHVALKPGRRLF